MPASSSMPWSRRLHDRRPAHRGGLVHHSDRGSQYVSIKYTERLAEAGIEPSVGSVGDSYDNALAETINGLYKAEVIHRRGPWRSFEAVEYATLEWVDWFNHRRLLEPIGNIPPAEAERSILCCRGQHRYGGVTHNPTPPVDPERFRLNERPRTTITGKASKRPFRSPPRSAVHLRREWAGEGDYPFWNDLRMVRAVKLLGA